jgi:hypothetical protein
MEGRDDTGARFEVIKPGLVTARDDFEAAARHQCPEYKHRLDDTPQLGVREGVPARFSIRPPEHLP